MSANMKKAIFTLKQVTIEGGKVYLSIGRDIIVGMSKYFS